MTPESEIRVAVVIPTYNNDATILDVIEGAAVHCRDIIVVDDGSTDGTGNRVSSASGIHRVSFAKNRGKGCALRAGFEKALSLGCTHAVTIDGDGQHVTDDIAVMKEKISAQPDAIWIGNRVMPCAGEDAPLRSRFGRKFGNFWYRFNTGIKLNDTQCGFRAYPLARTLELGAKGKRYEYEQDVLIRAAWGGIDVKEVDIHLKYLADQERISHFRPVRDFLRISSINARAGFLRVAFPVVTYHAPGHTLQQKIRAIVRYELRVHTTPRRAAFSVALGVFMAILPIHGFQVVTLMGLAALLGLNRPLAFLGVCVSSPPLLPVIIVAAVAIGRWILPANLVAAADPSTTQRVLQGGIEFVVGSTVLAFTCGIISYIALYPVFVKLNKAGILGRGRRA